MSGTFLTIGTAAIGLSAGPVVGQASATLDLAPSSAPAGTAFTATFALVPAGGVSCTMTGTFTWDPGPAVVELGRAGFMDGPARSCVAVLTTTVPASPTGSHRVLAETSYPGFRSTLVRASATFLVQVAPPPSTTTTTTTTTTATTRGSTVTTGVTPTTKQQTRPANEEDGPLSVWVIPVVVVVVVGAAGLVGARWFLGRRRRLDLSAFVDRCLGGSHGTELSRAGPATAALQDACDDPRRANPLLATLVWRSVTTSDRFSAVLAGVGCSPEGIRSRDFVVVAHAGGTRHDLVVFDPSFARPKPVTVRLSSEDAIALATSGEQPAARFDLTSDEIRRAVVEAAAVGTYGVVVTAPPLTTVTSCPTPAWPVGVDGDAKPVASVGVVAYDSGGVQVLTTALHAVASRTGLSVSGRPAVLVSKSEVTDSCVLRVEGLAYSGDVGSAGPLQGMTPRQDERATFDGVASGPKETRVTAWDLSILANQSFLGSKLYTTPDTVPGDSGAALLDSSGHILGFSVYYTGIGASIGYSAWSWADQVLVAHGLTVRPSGGGA